MPTNALLCILWVGVLLLLFAGQDVLAQQPQQRRNPTRVDVVGSVHIVRSLQAHVPGSSSSVTVELRCLEVRDPVDGFIKPDPSCPLPISRLANGETAVAAFQEKYNVQPGDIVKATFDVRYAAISSNGSSAVKSSSNRTLADEPARIIFRPDSLGVISRQDRQKEVYTGNPIVLSGVAILLDFCGWKNPFRSSEEFKRYMFSGLNGSISGNIEDYYRTCSFGKTIWSPKNIAVVGPLQIPCWGTYGGLVTIQANLSKGCSERERQFAFSQAFLQLQQLAKNDSVLSTVLSEINRRRFQVIFPREAVKCQSGIADQYCETSACRSFIRGTHATDPHVLFHELQHNHGLKHAFWDIEEYGDETDPMGTTPGTSQGPHCHNAPYNWRLGWATPVAGGNLTSGNFTPASNRRTFTIPASGLSDKNMVIINLGLASHLPDAASIPYPKFFFSYRVRNTTNGGYDAALKPIYSSKVIIHVYNGSINDRVADPASNFIDFGPRFTSADRAFANGTVWTSRFVPYNVAVGLGGGFRIRVVSTGPTAAVVEVCRMYSQKEGTPGSPECRANQDRDCDGLVGSNDPDCQP